ncbi:MAG: hypothetical protein Q9225_007149 [Loekoesia sp. 1 TL-2023]
MAEAVAALGFVSSVVSLIDISSRCMSRLHDFKSTNGQTPAVYEDILNQLPLLLEIIHKLKARFSEELLSQDAESAVFSSINGCIRQISKVDKLIEKWTPSAKESSIKRLRKAFGSVHDEKKIMEALRVLEMYKTTLHMYSTTSSRPASTESSTGVYDLPFKQLSYFVERQGIFQTLSHHLENTVGDTAGHRVIVLTGMGGQGKTQIALEYCKRSQASSIFKYVFWIDASTENALVRSYSTVAEMLSKPGVSFLDDKSRVSYVKEFLGRTSQRWLLVLDNFDRPDLFPCVAGYFPSGTSGALIITSRHAESERLGMSVAVPRMTEDESIKLLLHRAKKDITHENVTNAKKIAQKLGHLPLALDQAGSYILSRRLPLESFFEHEANRKTMILRHTPALWEYRKRRNGSESETSMNVFTTFELSLGQVQDGDESQAIIHFLTLSAFLDRAKIGSSLFRNCFVSLPKPLEWTSCFVTDGHWDGYRFQDLVTSLQAHSLVESTELGMVDTSFSIHPLIGDWLRLRIPENERLDYLREAIRLVTASIERESRVEVISEARSGIIAHMDACMEYTREIFSSDGNWAFSYLEDSADAFASVYNAHGRFEDAALLYVSLLDYQRRAGSPHTLRTTMNLANVLRNRGRYGEAEELYLQVLRERTRQLGPVHTDTSRALEGLAVIHSLQERFERAEKEYRQLLQILERTIGDFTPDTIRVVEGLANIRRHQSRYNIAEELYGRALQERMKSSGPKSPDTLRCVEGLAIVYRHQSRFEESIHLYRQVLGNLELTFGVDHPHTLRTAFNLSIAFLYRGHRAEAELMVVRAHEGFKALLGTDHVDTTRAAEQLAEVRRIHMRNAQSQQQAQCSMLPEISETCPHPQASQSPEISERRRKLIPQQCARLPEVLDHRGSSNPEFIPNSHSELLPPQAYPLTELLLKVQGMGIGAPKKTVEIDGPTHNDSRTEREEDEASCSNESISDQKRAKFAFVAARHESLSAGSPECRESSGTGSTHVVNLLMEHYGLGPDMKDSDGRTLLSRAAERGNADMVEFLLQRNDVLVNAKCRRYGWTPLMYASRGGHDQIIRLLLERKEVEVDRKDSRRITALNIAATHNRTEAARVLLDSKRVDVNWQGCDYGGSSLISAIKKGNADLVKMLLEAGASQKDTGSIESPLSLAVSGRHGNIVKILLANEHYDSEEVHHALLVALRSREVDLAAILVINGRIDLNERSWLGSTCLHFAAAQGHYQQCALLLNFGADASIRDDRGRTALFFASTIGHDRVVELLLSNPVVDANVKNADGRNALSYAFQHGHTGVVQRLLSAGSQADITELEMLEMQGLVTQDERHLMLQMIRKGQDAKHNE